MSCTRIKRSSVSCLVLLSIKRRSLSFSNCHAWHSHFQQITWRVLESVPASCSHQSPESVADGWFGGNRLNWTNFDTPSFLAILRDSAGDPQSSWSIGRRLAGAKQYRLFTNTSWPAGASKRLGLGAERSRALPVFVFSNKLHLSFSTPESKRQYVV